MPHVFALVSALMWGAADFAGGLLSRRARAVTVVALGQVAGLGAALGIAVASGHLTRDGAASWWAVLAGACGGVGLLAFYAALAAGRMGVVSPIAALGSIVPVAVGILGGERPSGVQYLGMVLTLAGASLAGGPEVTGAAGGRSVGLAALAGILFGTMLVGIDRAAETSIPVTLLLMRATSAVIMTSAVVVIGSRHRGEGHVRGAATSTGLAAVDRVTDSRAGFVVAAAVTGCLDLAANVTFALAGRDGMSSVVSVLGGLYPVATVALALLLLHERLRRVQTVGVLAALAGVGFIAA